MTIVITELRREELEKKIVYLQAQLEARQAVVGEQAINENGVGELKKQIELISRIVEKAEIVDAVDDDIAVAIGCRVRVYDFEFSEEYEYEIVYEREGDPLAGKISFKAPLGESLLSKQVGDVVVVDSPMGKYEVLILEIAKQ